MEILEGLGVGGPWLGQGGEFKWSKKEPQRRREGLCEITLVVGVWILSRTTQYNIYTLNNKLNYYI